VVAGVYLLFLANLILHGIVIWSEPLEKIAALGMAVIVILATVRMLRRDAFTRRVVLEVREEVGRALRFGLVASGVPLAAEVRYEGDGGQQEAVSSGFDLPPLSALRRLTFTVPTCGQREVKIWTHRVTLEGTSEPLPLTLSLGEGAQGADMKVGRGELTVPVTDTSLTVTLLPEHVASSLTL
jgi:hypothetical protein